MLTSSLTTKKLVFLICYVVVIMVSMVIASPTTTGNNTTTGISGHSLYNILENKGVNITTIGCKCIMTAPGKNKEDSTMCMCFNRKDGTQNESSKCSTLTDAVFTFCTDVTNTTEKWQTCLKNFCPCNSDINSPIPKDKFQF